MLAERLNISGQAVSKWENNLAQPDFDTILKLTEIFNITLDEFSKLCTEGEVEATPTEMEIASTATAVGKAEPVTPIAPVVISTPAPPPPPILIGVCGYCGTSLYNEKAVAARSPKLTCTKCEAAQDKKRREEEEKKRIAATMQREEQMKKLRWSLILPGIIIGILLIIAVANAPSFMDGLLSAVGGLLIYAIVVQIVWDNNWIASIFYGTFGWTFAKPGLIIPLSLDGFIWALCVKIAMAIIWFLISCVVTLAGLALCVVLTPVVLPFAIVATVRDIKDGTFN